MKIAIWGAGDIGRMTAYRFATLEFVSEIVWINRSMDKMESRRIDLDQGLAFAPTCRSIIAIPQEEAPEEMADCAILIMTAGAKVRTEGGREALYPDNAKIFRESFCPIMKGFKGVVIVVTNPVELLCRLVMLETGIPASRVIGLGTVVETARMQTFLRDFLLGTNSARDIQAYAIGTHNADFVPVIPEHCFQGERLTAKVLEAAHDRVQVAVAKAAERVKVDKISTLHPIVEGIAAVARAVANDTQTILTVASLDPADSDKLFYSLPSAVGANGVVRRYDQILNDAQIKAKLQKGIEAMRTSLRNNP